MRFKALMAIIILLCPAALADYRQVVISEFGGVDRLQVITQPGLPEPGPGQVRVRVLTASASFTDVMVRKGLYPGVTEEPPFPPGYDLVAVVDKIGSGVSALKRGQMVADLTVWGAYTEYAVLPAGNLVPVPEGIDAVEAAALILSYTTAYQMLYRVAEVKAGQSILIHGASGAVGTALAQLGKVSGLTMYGTASASKQDYVRSLGVTPIDYREEDFVSRIEAETGGAGVDVVFDAVGVDNFQRSYNALKPGGQLVAYGFYLATRDGDSMLATGLEFLRWKWQQLLWRWFPEQERRVGFYSIADLRQQQPEWFRQDLGSLFELLAEKNIQPRIWKTLPLTEAAQAHRAIENGEVRGKIVLRVSP
jgi:NADPH:quinone reductase-like Zn-dependent oxidoreductase